MRSNRLLVVAKTLISAGWLLAFFGDCLNAQNGHQKTLQDSGRINVFQQTFPVVEMNHRPADHVLPQYVDVGGQIPNYIQSDRWGELGEPLSLMQQPMSPEESLQHIVTPQGFRVELFAAEPDLQGKPLCMAWDERGRLWIGETVDYPNELQSPGMGRDRIRICEDTNGDGRADRFTVFAENLSIPSSIAFSKGGVIVQNGAETVYLKDTTGDGVADLRTTLITGWAMGDTHGGVSNFQYGLDNWIWAMQGYNASHPIALGNPQQPFRMGFFRMSPDASRVEFLRSTNNNTWGLGISEEGLIFGSTANGCPSVFLTIPNRYYERVRGWTPSLTLSSIADSNRFLPVTERVRQVDHFGGYTAAAGHALYTARQFPTEYWNRVAFVCEPTGHLVAAFVLSQDGSGFSATNPFNIFASHDEWTAPIMAEVGPDGAVWIIDWYNYIVQHNPTPKGFQTGKGNAYESALRDKSRGRIYRVVHEETAPANIPNLSLATPIDWVESLGHSSMVVRKHAQRLLVERGQTDVVPALISQVLDHHCDSTGLNAAAIHALWALHGLGVIQPTHPEALAAVYQALKHPSAGVRRNAIQVLPSTTESANQLLNATLHLDDNPNCRLAAILALADLPVVERTSLALLEVMADIRSQRDRWLTDAVTSAASQVGVPFLMAIGQSSECDESTGRLARIVAEHVSRGPELDSVGELITALQYASPTAIRWIFTGLSAGWQTGKRLPLNREVESDLLRLVERATPEDRPLIVRMAQRFGSSQFDRFAERLVDELLDSLHADEALDEVRISSAKHAVEFQPDSQAVALSLVKALTPRISPELAQGIMDALESSKCDSLGQSLIEQLPQLPPSTKGTVIQLLLKRPAFTLTVLEAIENKRLSLTDLALDQRQALSRHPDRQIRSKMKEILELGGSLPSPDRQLVLRDLAHVAQLRGASARGKEIFAQHCSKCHVHSGVGARVGPDLTGMSVHPREEMLIHILDPNRSVESNFRAYSVLTVDGLVLTGMLAAESKTAIELFDTEGKRQVILREDIEQLTASVQSIMPEGFEKTLTADNFTDLLEYLATPPAYVPLDIGRAATVASDRGMFVDPEGPERILFDSWSEKSFQGIPFQLIAPRDGRLLNAIVLYSRLGKVSSQLPTSVSLTCNVPVKALHLLSGVAGWAHPLGQFEEVVMVVRLHYQDGETEDHQLLNGVHFADYIRRIDVPKSQIAYSPGGKQIRYLSIQPRRADSLTSIEFLKGTGDYSPVVMAVTVEPLGGVGSQSTQ